MKTLKKFFGIDEKFRLEWADLSAILTALNVLLIIAGVCWAPVIGIINCAINIILNIINRGHINMYVLNIALIVMNIYFLV